LLSLWFGVLALKTGFPPRRDIGYDWALDRAHLWRNGVEHLERSGELRGRAVVDNENEEGETESELISAEMKKNRMEAEALVKGARHALIGLGSQNVSSRSGCEYIREDANGYRGECE
jgi:hypothetical protein